MKKIDKVLGLGFLVTLLALSCRKIDVPVVMNTIDLGVKSTATSIQNISQTGNVVTAEFVTTPGAKYSVQVIPFGKDESIKTEGFTATDTLTKKVFDLSALPKKDYDLIFIDIAGKEVKHPIIIK
jgi:hypothetical protein